MRRHSPGAAPISTRWWWTREPDGAPTPLRSARLAWEAAYPGATHHLVLQDDAVPCADFRSRLTCEVLRPVAIPFVHQGTGRALCHFVRETPGPAGKVVRAPRLLRERGLPADRLVETLAAFLRGTEAELLDAPLARTALSTMGFGALRRMVPFNRLESLAKELTSLLFAGARAGVNC